MRVRLRRRGFERFADAPMIQQRDHVAPRHGLVKVCTPPEQPCESEKGRGQTRLESRTRMVHAHAARPVSSPWGPFSTFDRSTTAVQSPRYAIVCTRDRQDGVSALPFASGESLAAAGEGEGEGRTPRLVNWKGPGEARCLTSALRMRASHAASCEATAGGCGGSAR